jgi:hypothetical protein
MNKLEIAGLDDSTAKKLASNVRLRQGDPYDSTYWDNFIHEASHLLSETQHGWGLVTAPTIHAESKLVDVRLSFAPRTHP